MKPEKIISEAMRLLGSRTSKAKAAASRANGKKGGRPRNCPHCGAFAGRCQHDTARGKTVCGITGKSVS